MNQGKFFKHKSAIVERGIKIGPRTKIWHLCHVTSTARIGKNCSIGRNCYIAGIVGSGCKIQNNVNVYQGVTLKDFVFCGPSMTFTNVFVPRAKYPVNGKYEKTLVKTGASLGAHCTILPGVTVGKWALVGAGAVVTKDVPDFTIVYGNPAKVHGWICECGSKLPTQFIVAVCSICKRNYMKKGTKVAELNK